MQSRAVPGVSFRLRRVSFGARVELMRRIRELALRAEFLEAGGIPGETMDAALARAEMERVFVGWGVRAVEGLAVDGAAATVEALAEQGPEPLFREALGLVRAEAGLDGGRTKKLMVAFHFQFANQAGWKCDSCRKHGLEKRRRCKRIPCAQREPGESLVWARKGVGTTVCRGA